MNCKVTSKQVIPAVRKGSLEADAFKELFAGRFPLKKQTAKIVKTSKIPKLQTVPCFCRRCAGMRKNPPRPPPCFACFIRRKAGNPAKAAAAAGLYRACVQKWNALAETLSRRATGIKKETTTILFPWRKTSIFTIEKWGCAKAANRHRSKPLYCSYAPAVLPLRNAVRAL